MASVELRPGDTLNIVWSSVQDTPLGTKEVESSFAFTYDELLARLKAKGKAGKSRRSGTLGARFSRFVALSTTALRKGCWSTGAEIDRNEVFERLVNRLQELDPEEHRHMTPNARQALVNLFHSKNILKGAQKTALKAALDYLHITIPAQGK